MFSNDRERDDATDPTSTLRFESERVRAVMHGCPKKTCATEGTTGRRMPDVR